MLVPMPGAVQDAVELALQDEDMPAGGLLLRAGLSEAVVRPAPVGWADSQAVRLRASGAEWRSLQPPSMPACQVKRSVRLISCLNFWPRLNGCHAGQVRSGARTVGTNFKRKTSRIVGDT